MRKWMLILLGALIAGCGTTWTVGFGGATLSVQFPLDPVATAVARVEILPRPAALPVTVPAATTLRVQGAGGNDR